MEDKKEFEIVTGDSSNLNISPVSKSIVKPSGKKPKDIVIPKSHKEKNEDTDSSN